MKTVKLKLIGENWNDDIKGKVVEATITGIIVDGHGYFGCTSNPEVSSYDGYEVEVIPQVDESILEPFPEESAPMPKTSQIQSLRDMLGQDLKIIEFK